MPIGKSFLAASVAANHDFDLKSNAGLADLMALVIWEEVDEYMVALHEADDGPCIDDDDWFNIF